MCHGVGTDHLGDLDLALSDQRARDGGAQQILALIQRVGAEHRKDEVLHEGLAQIVDEDLLHAEHFRFLARRPKLLALAEIGGEGHDLTLVGGLQPTQDHAGVQPARIGENHFLHILDAHAGKLLDARGSSAVAKGRQYQASVRAFPTGRYPRKLRR